MMEVIRQKIMVVGDLMLDRSWTVESRGLHARATSQSHGGVIPFTRLYPTAVDYRVGGAGMTAMSILPIDNMEVHLLSAEVGAQEIDTFEACHLVRADAKQPEQTGVIWHTLPWYDVEPLTTIKWRMYDPYKLPDSQPFFFLRLDQDPPKSTESLISPNLPSRLAKSYDAIILMDFAKGVVTDELVANLCDQYPDAVLGIDSKQPRVLKKACEISPSTPIGFLNREEAIVFFSTVLANSSESDLKAEFKLSFHELLPRLDDNMLALRDELESNHWIMIIKLDKDGAVAYEFKHDQLRRCHAQLSKHFEEATSIGAGDFFAGGFIDGYIKNSDPELKVVAGLESAMLFSYDWINYCREGFWRVENDDQGQVKKEQPWPSDPMVVVREMPDAIAFSELQEVI